MTEGERGRNGEEEEEELDHWWRPGLSGSWRPAWPKTLVFWAEWHHFICSGKKRSFSRLNLDTGAGGGDFCRLLSTLVGSGIPDNALLIAFSSSTLVKMFMVLLVKMRAGKCWKLFYGDRNLKDPTGIFDGVTGRRSASCSVRLTWSDQDGDDDPLWWKWWISLMEIIKRLMMWSLVQAKCHNSIIFYSCSFSFKRIVFLAIFHDDTDFGQSDDDYFMSPGASNS